MLDECDFANLEFFFRNWRFEDGSDSALTSVHVMRWLQRAVTCGRTVWIFRCDR